MNRAPLLLLFAGLFLLTLTSAGRQDIPVASAYPSRVSEALVTYQPEAPEEHSPANMAAAARAFLEGLDPARRAQAALALDSPERARWTNVPPGSDEGGVRLGDCTLQELQCALDLLRAVLSADGYARIRDTLLADDRLLDQGRPRRGFGAENFWLAIFGRPAADDTWALQLDGHHLALNLTFAGDRMGMSPTFLGAQPASFTRGTERFTPLAAPVDSAYAFLGSLDEPQRTRAVVANKRGQMETGAGGDGVVPEPSGLACTGLASEQRAQLRALVAAYVGIMPEPYAANRMRALDDQLDQLRFAWSGPTTDPSDISYRVQGPTLILEYACQNLGGNPLDHLHAMYRDPTNEYGAGF